MLQKTRDKRNRCKATHFGQALTIAGLAANRAGLKVGDALLAVDGFNMAAHSAFHIINKLPLPT